MRLSARSVLVALVLVCGVLFGAYHSASAQQVLDSSGRYVCQTKTVRDLRTGKPVTIAALNKSTNRQIAALTKKLKKTKNKGAAARIRTQIAGLRAFLARANSCLKGTLAPAVPTPVPATPTPSEPTATPTITPTPTNTPTPGVPLPHVSVGIDHTCSASLLGIVRCWGGNNDRQLGVGAGSGSASLRLPAVGLAKAAIGGGRHSCSAPLAGAVTCWGRNDLKQATGNLADGLSQTDPVSVLGVSGDFVQVVAGDRHSCAVQKTGGVLCWGENSLGQCGTGAASTRVAATSVALATTVTKIATYNSHTCAVLGNGSVQCWGWNAYQQLGTGPNDWDTRTTATTPKNLRQGVSVVDVAPGNDHTCVLYQDGVVQCVGQDDFGQIGQGATSYWRETLRTVSLGAATAIAAGDDFTCAIVSGQTGVACWGKGTSGQLGNGGTTSSATPVSVSGLPAGVVVWIGVGFNSACAVVDQGSVRSVWCWGDNTSGKLGSVGGSSTTARQVPGLDLNS